MQIAKHKVVSIDYTLRQADGEIIDTSEGEEPLLYLHGVGALVPGLERELEGKLVGDSVDVVVSPEEGYGTRNEDLEHVLNRSQFEGIDDLQIGMQFRVDTDDGPMVVTVVSIEGDKVGIDGNHPLAGLELHFSVEICEIRDATDEEIEHGHAHGPGSHHHH